MSPPKIKGGQWTENVLHSFAGGTDGAVPNGGLIIDSRGDVYGTTSIGGSQFCNFGNGNVGWCGLVFALLPRTVADSRAWEERVVHRFNGTDGEGPNGGLVFGVNGSIFGAAGGGGSGNGFGVVFRLTSTKTGAWTETVLYSFQGGSDGYAKTDCVFIW